MPSQAAKHALDHHRSHATAVKLFHRDDDAETTDFEEDANVDDEESYTVGAPPVGKRSKKEPKVGNTIDWEWGVMYSYNETTKMIFQVGSVAVAFDGMNLGYFGEVLQMVVRHFEAREVAWTAPQVGLRIVMGLES